MSSTENDSSEVYSIRGYRSIYHGGIIYFSSVLKNKDSENNSVKESQNIIIKKNNQINQEKERIQEEKRIKRISKKNQRR